jgi:hypothetical protein
MDDVAAIATSTRIRRFEATIFAGVVVSVVAVLVLVAVVLHALFGWPAVSTACGTLDQMPVTRQVAPARGESSTYCLPGAVAIASQHPELRVSSCLDFRLAGPSPSTELPRAGNWQVPLGTLVSPDDQTLTVVWNGVANDVGVIVESGHDVRVGFLPRGATPGAGTYFAASLRLAKPLGRRSVRLIEPRPGLCD